MITKYKNKWKKYSKKSLILAVILTNCTVAFSQTNNPCGAPILTINATCVNTLGTTVAATYQSNAANGGVPSCASPGAPDVWYSFVAPASGSVTITTDVGTITDGGMSLYSGPCGSPTQIVCDDDGGPGLMPMITQTGLTSGSTYWIRFWAYGGTNTGTFNICITPGPTPATNDECATSIALTVNPNLLCGTVTPGTVIGASASAPAIAPCSGTPDDDVWFKFVATGTSHQVSLTNVAGSTTDMYHAVYSGTCGALVNIACNDADVTMLTGLTPGNTYYIRVYTYTSTTGQTSTFNVCIGTPPPPPANDDCTGAIALTVNPNLLCGTVTAGTVASALPSAPATGCSGTADDDVWYKFVATGTSHQVSLTNVAGSTTDMYHAVYSGTCGALVNIACNDADVTMLTGLTPGATYYVRVYTYTSTTGQTSTFNVCVGTPPPPPANDNCPGAITLTVNPNQACGTVTSGTITSATASAQANGCSGTADDDVWYRFQATSTSHTVDLINVTGSTTDLYHNVYAGTCAAPGAALVCSDPNNSIVTGLTIGNWYYVRIFSWTSTTGQTSTFDVCIGTPPPPPANDNCVGSVSVTPGASCVPTSGTVASATQSQAGCSGTADDDVWYSFVATNTTQYISVFPGGGFDPVVQLFSGACVSLTSLSCNDASYPYGSSGSGVFTGLTIGQTYHYRIYDYYTGSPTTPTFTTCVTNPLPPPSNDNCTGAIAVTVNPDQNCGSVTPGYINSATASSQANTCGGTADDDVWFSFVATSTTHSIDLLNIVGSTTDLFHSVYSGTCGSIGTPIVCSDPNSSTVSGLTIGNTYYVRVYSWTSTVGQTASFNICIGVQPPPSGGADCSNAEPFCTGTTYNFPMQTNNGTAVVGPDYGCLCSQPNPVWYYLQIATSGSIGITISSTCGDIDYAAWGPFPTITCSDVDLSTGSVTCGGNFAAPNGNMVDCAYSTAATEVLDIPGAIVGQYYMVMINNYANCTGNAIFSQTSGTGATNCAIVIPCDITAITANVSNCPTAGGTYTVSGTVTFNDAPNNW